MGLNAAHTKWMLLMKKKNKVDFSNIATLGRQTLYIKKDDKNLSQFFDIENALQEDGYSEQYWSILAGKESKVDSFDISEFEQATVIHDMNDPLPEIYQNKYGVVVDGGTLEHVFTYTTALHNAMSMVSGGGYFIIMTPSNNQCGHGFYQFSPELFYSVLNEKNGFRIIDMTAIVEKSVLGGTKVRYYRLRDNTKTGERLMLHTSHRTYLLILAKRIGNIPKKQLIVQQSDYISLWNNKKVINKKSSGIKQILKRNKMIYKMGIYYLEKKEKNKVSKFATKYNIDRELKKYNT